MGKKQTWRKTVDMEQVDRVLEEQRAEQRQYGSSLSTLPNEQLFSVDTSAQDQLLSSTTKKMKPLRLDQILESRSAVPCPVAKKMSSKKIAKCERQLVWKAIQKGKQDAKQDEINKKSPYFDLWASSSSQGTPLIEKNETLIPHVELPHPGASYRPTASDHGSLVETLADKIIKDEEIKEKWNTLAREILEGQKKESLEQQVMQVVLNEDNENLNQKEESNSVSKILPVPKMKTKAQRQAQLRQKEQQRQSKELKQERHLLSSIDQIPRLLKEISHTSQHHRSRLHRRHLLERLKRHSKPLRLARHRFQESELVLPPASPTEIAPVLRQLTPQGNLFMERFQQWQKRNTIETRFRVTRKRKYALKEYEKQSYKQFK